MARTALKVFRVQHRLSQKEMSDKIGCNRATYSSIENGTRNGRQSFWQTLQNAFHIPDSEIWELMKKDDEKDEQRKKGDC